MRIPIRSGFMLIPEGTYVFKIESIDYDEDFGTMKINMVTAKGMKYTERFQLKDGNDELNEKALSAFSFFAMNAMNDFNMEDIDYNDMVGRYIQAEVVHTTLPSKKDPTKTSTFANLGKKAPADGFEGEAVAPKKADLDSLLD